VSDLLTRDKLGQAAYVYLDSKNLRLPTDGAHKLGHGFNGPYKILKRMGPVDDELDLPWRHANP
jgi:hypothetical protein